MKSFCRYAKDSYTFLVRYLATFAGADASMLHEAKEEAVRAIIEFVKSPDMFQVKVHPDMPFHRVLVFIVTLANWLFITAETSVRRSEHLPCKSQIPNIPAFCIGI